MTGADDRGIRPRRLAIIPARGGSKRIRHKNTRNFCGKPMIAHILDAAKESNLFEKVHVSTDSSGIADAVRDLGHKIDFMRPAELADDQTPIMPVLKYVTQTYADQGDAYDQVCLLMACSPLIEAEDLVGAAAVFDAQEDKRPVISVTSFPVPIEWAFEMVSGNRLSPTTPGAFAIRSQDLGEKYYDTGSFVFFPANDVIASDGAGSDSNYVGYPIPKYKAIDIDDQDDWEMAEVMFRGLGR